MSSISITGLGNSAAGSRLRRIINSTGMLVSIGLLVTATVAACTAGKAPGSAAPGSSHPGTATGAASAPAAWHRLQAAYAACPAQAGNPQITLTETAQAPDAMAWFHNTNGARSGDLALYTHEYFVLHQTQIAYQYVDDAGPALATTPNDAQVLATITRHLNA